MPPPTSAIFMGCGRSSTSGLSAKAERVLPRPVSTSFRTGRCSISPAGRRWISSPMSELADRERLRKQHWAAPGGSHDNVVRLLKLALPVLIGVLMAYLALAPLSKNQEISRSEEHTSELQSLMRISYAVFCLKKKKKQTN